MGDAGWGISLILGIVAAVTIIAVTSIRNGLAVEKAKVAAQADLARDDAYRNLAQQATTAQQSIGEAQHKIAQDLADLRERMASIEKMMREVG